MIRTKYVLTLLFVLNLGLTLGVRADETSWFSPEFNIEKLVGETPTENNSIDFMADGTNFFPVRMGLINGTKAGDTIDIQTFLWCDDDAGIPVAQALAAAQARGVRVRAIIDWANAPYNKHQTVYSTLEKAGIPLLQFNPPWWGPEHFNNIRMHEKVMVVNGSDAIIGGANLCDEYQVGHEKPLWHDFEMHLRGPIASRIQARYDTTFNFVSDRDFQARWERATAYGGVTEVVKRAYPRYKNPTPSRAEPAGSATALYEYQQPYLDCDYTRRFMERYISLLTHAKKRVVLYMPYYDPPKEFHNAIVLTARRAGMEVILFTNSPISNDNGNLAVLASTRHFKSLLASGIKIYEVPDHRTLHGKAMFLDGEAMTVGSHNRDNRSFFDQGETSVFTTDPSAIRQFQATVDADLAHYRVVDQAMVDERLKGLKGFEALFVSMFEGFL
jgi:cardiolipin synthase